MNVKAIREGVTESFDFWLSQHDVSTPECIIEGVEKAFRTWLENNEDRLIEAIAAACARKKGLS